MKTYLDCVPCFFKQAIESAKFAGADKKMQRKVISEIAQALSTFPLKASPPEMGRIIYGLVRKITKTEDPYRDIKIKSSRLALKLYPRLKKKVLNSHDRLFTAVELAIAGNIIDFGVKNSLNVGKELKRILNEEDKAIKKEGGKNFNYVDFKRVLKQSKVILYLADNTGETVFDRVLIEEIKRIYQNKKIIYAVKEKPIINDCLIEDAYFCGLDKIAEVISSGLDSPGTILKLCSVDFRRIFKTADMIISKGQGNFEALSNTRRAIFFLFMAKCDVVAKHMHCNIGDIILLHKVNKKRDADKDIIQ